MGSTRSAFQTSTATPATMAATEPAASDAMCRNAPRMLRLAPRDRQSRTALPRFTSSPSEATTITPPPFDVGRLVEPARPPRR